MPDSPRVITLSEVLEELREGQYIWIEINDDERQLFHAQLDWINPIDNGECEYEFLMPRGLVFTVSTAEYGKDWRVWSGQVTWVQMEEASWDAAD